MSWITAAVHGLCNFLPESVGVEGAWGIHTITTYTVVVWEKLQQLYPLLSFVVSFTFPYSACRQLTLLYSSAVWIVFMHGILYILLLCNSYRHWRVCRRQWQLWPPVCKHPWIISLLLSRWVLPFIKQTPLPWYIIAYVSVPSCRSAKCVCSWAEVSLMNQSNIAACICHVMVMYLFSKNNSVAEQL